MNDKDKIIKRLVVDTGIPEQHIKYIIDDIFQAALEAMKNNNSVEISGLGKMMFNKPKAVRELTKLIDKIPTEASIEKQQILLNVGSDLTNKLENEEDKLVADFRRMAEQINSSRTSEGIN